MPILLLFVSILLTGCSDRRIGELEQTTRTLKNDLADLRSLQADHSSEINQIRSEMRQLSGIVEEVQHLSAGKTKELERSLTQLRSRVPPPPGVPDDLLSQDENKIGRITGEAAEQYKQALQQMRAGDFEAARGTLSTFSEANPGTAFSDNALFWLGICYDQLGQTDRAVVAFSDAFQRYPAEDMVPPSLYYLAESFNKLDSKSDAILTLQKLVDEHPNSTFAGRARTRLEELQGGGRRRRNR